ncbi:hypothetical protein [Melissospora conviva]|uniref:hypothetical protein n=1 Tax=Melissospora conviva TaxID=3388432 RepID=UPI003C17DECC
MRYQDEQTRDEHPETVRSTPVPVAATSQDPDRDEHTDGLTQETVDDRGSYDRDHSGEYDADGVRRDDDVTFHEPAPASTTFGATSVGEDVAASALANPRTDVQPDPNDDSTVAVGDGRRDGATEAATADRVADTDAADRDPALGRGIDTTTTDRHTDPANSEELGTDDFTAAHSGSDELPAQSVADSGVATGQHETGDGHHGATTDGHHSEGPSLLAAGTGTHLKERWRDVQLRFVDDPKGAAGEAQELVESAIDEIAASLKRSREELGDWQGSSADDTEKLRMAVRRYRDFLDRLVAL